MWMWGYLAVHFFYPGVDAGGVPEIGAGWVCVGLSAAHITHEGGYRWAAMEPHPMLLEPNGGSGSDGR